MPQSVNSSAAEHIADADHMRRRKGLASLAFGLNECWLAPLAAQAGYAAVMPRCEWQLIAGWPQVALIMVMAQLGCHVPAAFASIRPADRLFTRIGTGDSIETNSSSFMVEMQDTAYITAHATSRFAIPAALGRPKSSRGWSVALSLTALKLCVLRDGPANGYGAVPLAIQAHWIFSAPAQEPGDH